ncbi:MAG: hypothetical protein EOO10_23030 [Chitinophagaceae bacterium]|nr:MAG: hypothetical protein EOO10_23030 [Chitinophagaceae bacterium]
MELFSFLTTCYKQMSEDARISATHISLYMALTQEWNLTGGKNPFPINREAIMKAAKINARFTYNKCINNLQEYGYIKYLPSSNSFRQSIIYLKSIQ